MNWGAEWKMTAAMSCLVQCLDKKAALQVSFRSRSEFGRQPQFAAEANIELKAFRFFRGEHPGDKYHLVQGYCVTLQLINSASH